MSTSTMYVELYTDLKTLLHNIYKVQIWIFWGKVSFCLNSYTTTTLQYGFALQVWKGQGFKLSQRNNLSLPGNWIYVVFLTDVTTRPVHTGQKYENSAMKKVYILWVCWTK